MKRYLEHSIENMRDLGGYNTPYGKISYCKLIRSNLPYSLSDQDLDFLKRIGISTVIVPYIINLIFDFSIVNDCRS